MKSKIEFHPLFSLSLTVPTVGEKNREEYEKQKGFARDCKARKCMRKENNKILFLICFNSNSEMQVNHLREGSGPHCASYSRDGLGRRQFRMETRENTSPGSSPLGYGVCSAERGLLGILPEAPGKAGLLMAVAGEGPSLLGALLPSQSHCPPVTALSSNCIYGFLKFSKRSNFFPQTIFFTTEIGSPPFMETNKTA